MQRLVLALLLCSACTFFGSALSGAGDQAGRNLGARMVSDSSGGSAAGQPQGAQPASYNAGGGGGGMSAATMPPSLMSMYMSTMLTYAFSPGGYDVSENAYKAGEYTRWSGRGDNGKTMALERAHLSDDAQGRQWWKVKFTDEQGRTTIIEGLLDAQAQKFVRMRAKFPDDAAGNELPVDQQTWYRPAQKLSPESIEGASRGVESVSVPAGTFQAKHIVFGGVDGSHEWWLASAVPGGAVKQLAKSPRSEQSRYEMTLTAYGSDAQSELGSK